MTTRFSLKITTNRYAPRGGIQLAADAIAERGARGLIYLARREVGNRTPIRTGVLKRSWKVVRRSRERYSLQNRTPYAYVIENGRRGTRFRGYHMLREGLKAARTKWRAYQQGAQAQAAAARAARAAGAVNVRVRPAGARIGGPQVSLLGRTYGQPVAGLGAGGGPAPVRIPGVNIPRVRVPGF